VDRDLLVRAYDRTAGTYDEQFRAQQREKYRAAARLLEADRLPPGPVLDAGGGTALFAEWLADAGEPSPEVREQIRARRARPDPARPGGVAGSPSLARGRVSPRRRSGARRPRPRLPVPERVSGCAGRTSSSTARRLL